jgi:DNA invertase Pin-like site-specific DNA recombinase
VSRGAGPSHRRCAIYTRKSSESGLEQSFNSLQAQREACEAFVRSQRHEGWRALASAYDDGGFSGGTLERPGLARLLDDIDAGRVDVVVVYKVDRLSRSLADFVRLVERFDARAVSFVSVTQQFNTASSMGRLTLNVLLSFAQFEREVTSERIRDKIAASKRKGLWMGGPVPLGYDVVDRALVVNATEAERVVAIFEGYLRLGCVRRLKESLDARGCHGKVRDGRAVKPFSRGALYRLLQNPVYVGEVAHKGQRYPGQHEGIVATATWERVQARLAGNRRGRHRRAKAKEPGLLAGLLFDDRDHPMTPTHATKGARRYRYYVSRPAHQACAEEPGSVPRVRADTVERLVVRRLHRFLTSGTPLLDAVAPPGATAETQSRLLACARGVAGSWGAQSPTQRVAWLRQCVHRVVITATRIDVEVAVHGLRGLLLDGAAPPDAGDATPPLRLGIPARLERRGIETKLVVRGGETPDMAHTRTMDAMRSALARALRWNDELLTGKASSMTAIAKREGVSQTYVAQLIKLAFLAPDIMTAIARGRVPDTLSLDRLKKGFPLQWKAQREALGFPPAGG